MSNLDKLTANVRKAAGSQAWSQGAILCRNDAVILENRDANELVFRVKAPHRVVPFEVVLYPGELEWECSCDRDSCAHAAAAVIYLGTEHPHGSQPARMGYQLRRRSNGVVLERSIVDNGSETPLRGRLSAYVSDPQRQTKLLATSSDLEIDRVVGAGASQLLPYRSAQQVIRQLNGQTIPLDGAPVVVDEEPLGLIATLCDHPHGVRLTISTATEVEELLGSGLALDQRGALRPLTASTLSGVDHERLPIEKIYRPGEFAELVAEVLPALQREVEVDIFSQRLPGHGGKATPRIHFDLRHHDGALEVLPTLVYGDPPEARVDGDSLVHLGGNVPRRNRAQERSLLIRLRQELNLQTGQRSRFEAGDAGTFVAKLQLFQDSGSAAPLQVAASSLRPVVAGETAFAIDFVDDQGNRVTGQVVIDAWASNHQLLPTAAGMSRLPMDWLQRYGHWLRDLLEARSLGATAAVTAAPILALARALDRPPPPDVARLAPLVENFTELPPAQLPADFLGTLRDYQEHGVRWLQFMNDAGLGAVLADDMGLGKTIQALAVVRTRTLIVCPKSTIFNWCREIARFRPGLTATVYHGTERSLEDRGDVVITTYALLRNDIERLGQIDWQLVILDEAQNIKNPASQTALAAFRLPAKARLALTGTPIENRLGEMWSLMHFCNRGFLGGRASFRKHYEEPIARGDSVVAASLSEKLKAFVLRRRKSEVARELPARTDAVLHCVLSPEERSLYDGLETVARSQVSASAADGKSIMKAFESLLRLRQAACHPALLPNAPLASSSKVDRLVEVVGEIADEGHKALVFSQWTALLDLIEPQLEGAGVTFLRLDGKSRDRQAIVDAFQADDGPSALLVSLKAGGTGLNLTAADHVFILDPWWNPAAEEQAADRAHRIGQDKPVMVYRLISEDTVEARIVLLQESKRRLADSALAGATSGKDLTREDLLALLGSSS